MSDFNPVKMQIHDIEKQIDGLEDQMGKLNSSLKVLIGGALTGDEGF